MQKSVKNARAQVKSHRPRLLPAAGAPSWKTRGDGYDEKRGGADRHDEPKRAEELHAVLKDYLASYKPKAEFRAEPSENNAAEVILETAKGIGAGLILMGAFTRSSLKDFFLGSVTRNVLDDAPCPMLLT